VGIVKLQNWKWVEGSGDRTETKQFTLPLTAQPPAAVEAQTVAATEMPAKVNPNEVPLIGDPLPKASIKIDGNFDDWKTIPPAFSATGSPKKDVAANLAIDKVYLAADENNLYMRLDIMDTTPSSFFHRHNFNTDHNSSYGLDIENGLNHVVVHVGFAPPVNSPYGTFIGNRWYAEIGRIVSGNWEYIDRVFAYYNMKGSSLEASFPLKTIQKSLADLPTGGSCNVTARSGYIDGQWVYDWASSTASKLQNWKWVEGSGDRTETKQFTF
jgi:hypothetical protein